LNDRLEILQSTNSGFRFVCGIILHNANLYLRVRTVYHNLSNILQIVTAVTKPYIAMATNTWNTDIAVDEQV